MQNNRKTGISFLVDVPRYVKMALKEKESKGSIEHQKVITLLKLLITNLENGIWIVTWNELVISLKHPNVFVSALQRWNLIAIPFILRGRWQLYTKHREGGKRNLDSEEATDFFFLFLSFFPGQKCLPAALRCFCGTAFCTVTFFGWEWLAYISFPKKWTRKKPLCVSFLQ